MKLKLLAAAVMAVTMGALQAGPAAGGIGPAGLIITSPDHPATWEVGFNDKVGQALRWSERDGKLYLDVTYSKITYTDTIPPSDFKTYRLAFPDVSLDAAGRLYVVGNRKQKIVIGAISTGPFGRTVALNRGVDLSAHRRNGRIDAKLEVKGTR